MKNLEILNVVYIDCGILSSVRSFPMTDENREEQIKNAESCFIQKIKDLVGDTFGKEVVIEDGFYDFDGVYIALSWSII